MERGSALAPTHICTHIYKDMYEIMVPRNRTLSVTAIFFVSVIFHEYVLAFDFGFFYPMMFIFFTAITGFFTAITGFPMFFKVNSVVMWFSRSFGNGSICMRWNSMPGHNCPLHPNYYLDLFIPRSWYCQKQFNA